MSTNKRDLQKVDLNKFWSEASTPKTLRRGLPAPSNAHGDLTAQIDPRINLRRELV